MRRAVAIGALSALDVAALGTLRPSATLLTDLAHPHRWVATVGADAAAARLAEVALWLVACWLGVGLLACALGLLPGTCGRIAAKCARVALPAALYRLAAGATGLGLMLGPVTASAVVPNAGNGTAAAAVAPAWPVGNASPAPSWPVRSRAPQQQIKPPQYIKPHSSKPRPPHVHRAPAERVVVTTGDTLWQIAADSLPRDASPARIARAWPRWFAANTRTIGADPNLIRPGEVLHAPAPHVSTEGHRP